MLLLLSFLFTSCFSTASTLTNLVCSLSKSEQVVLENVPTSIDFSVHSTIVLLTNSTELLTSPSFEINILPQPSNKSICRSINRSSSLFRYKTEFVLKFDRNHSNDHCIELKLLSGSNDTEWSMIELCPNKTREKVIDNDDQYGIQLYMRTVNTSEIAVQDNFNWLIFGSPTQRIWHTHEGMRLGRDCDAAEDGRVAIFSNPRGKRRLISRPIDMSNVSLLHIRLGSGSCPPPPPTEPAFQLSFTDDCIHYKQWRLIYSQKILPGVEFITVPVPTKNFTKNSVVCLKIEQPGDRFTGSGSWFIDDISIVRYRKENKVFYQTFAAMQPGEWHRLVGGHLKSCDGRLSMFFEPNIDIRSEIGATTIDLHLSDPIDYDRDALFYLSKRQSTDWNKWHATGFLSLNSTCSDEDVITFNGENYRQLCSPIVELGRIDSIRFTLSAEPCGKRSKSFPSPSAMVFLSIQYNRSSIAYSRTIHSVLLREIQTTEKTFNVRMDELRHGAHSFGRVCLSQYHQTGSKQVDVWSVRDFFALPVLPKIIKHYIQLSINTKCSQSTSTNGISNPNIDIEYSLTYGKTWHTLLQPCFLDSSCSRDVQHVYSSQIAPPTSGWHRITLPLPLATLNQEHIRFRIGTPSASVPIYPGHDSWALEKVFIGDCHRGCNGNGWCQSRSCKCDPGYFGAFCEKSNTTLLNRDSFLFDRDVVERINHLTYQGGRVNYKCNIISQGKALVFSKTGFRFVRLFHINGSSPKILEFTLRLGGANPQCFGTSPTDSSRHSKAILLLSSCSNGAHWKLVDVFRIDDVLAPEFGTLVRILFNETAESDDCLIEWRQMAHSGENQDVWAIDDITIRDLPHLKNNRPVQNLVSNLTYVRPGYILSFQADSINSKDVKSSIDWNDIRLRLNSTQLDLSRDVSSIVFRSLNSSVIFIISLPKSFWYQYVTLNLSMNQPKKFQLSSIHFGVQCENNCWLHGICVDGICHPVSIQQIDTSAISSFNEAELRLMKINPIEQDILLPLIDSTEFIGVHYQTIAVTLKKSSFVFQCSPNGGITWILLEQFSGEKDDEFKDHFISVPSVCRTQRTLFRWKNRSIRLVNTAFVRSRSQHYFFDQFQNVDLTKWLYRSYSINMSKMLTNRLTQMHSNQSIHQLITTAITLKGLNSILMIDFGAKLDDKQRIRIDYSIDNITWNSLADEDEFRPSTLRYAFVLPKNVREKSILVRLQSMDTFTLRYIYLGPPCPANCYGLGLCVWNQNQAICSCDSNRTSEFNCSPNEFLLSSIYETFENMMNDSRWSISSHGQITHRCYNRLSKTTPYLCFQPLNHTGKAFAIIGPFKPIKYVAFKLGLQYVTAASCSNRILFQYSYDNGLQWTTKLFLDQTKNVFEFFDDLEINQNIRLRWIEETNHSCLMWNLRSVTIRTREDQSVWMENNLQTDSKTKLIHEAQTWEYSSLPTGSLIQFDLQTFPIKKSNRTDWQLRLEISSDMYDGWSLWSPLIPWCNQSQLYCEDRISLTGSTLIASSYLTNRKMLIPIPDIYAYHNVRFRWIADESDGRFLINHVYVGADCPWFCSGHGFCQKSGCQCQTGYVLPFCSPDSGSLAKARDSVINLTANLSRWSDIWGFEFCSSEDHRMSFSQVPSRGLISPEIVLTGMKYLRIEFNHCDNVTYPFRDPILVQYSINNGILWNTLSKIIEPLNSPSLIELPDEPMVQVHPIRLRLFQRVDRKGISSWILSKFEIIPEKLPQLWKSPNVSSASTCYTKKSPLPIEISSTIDVQMNQSSFLSFQVVPNPCSNSNQSSVELDECPFDLEYSIDFGRHWISIDQPSNLASHQTEIILRQPIHSMKNVFYVPLEKFYPIAKFLRFRWMTSKMTIANEWRIDQAKIISECDVICGIDPCFSHCFCKQTRSCSGKQIRNRTFFSERNRSFSSSPVYVPALNLLTTKFVEFQIHSDCQENQSSSLSLEYSANLGLSWRLFRYWKIDTRGLFIIHEEFDENLFDEQIQFRFVFLNNIFNCLKIDQIAVTGSNLINQNQPFYANFSEFDSAQTNSFVSFGNGTLNGSLLIFSMTNSSQSDDYQLITEDLLILNNSLYIQLVLVPLSAESCCLNIRFSYSSDYGHQWQSIDHDENILFNQEQMGHEQIFNWPVPASMISASQVRFRIIFEHDQRKQSFDLGIRQFYVGSMCPNACNRHGTCTNTRQCRCHEGWTNGDCSLPLLRFPHEIDILQQNYSQNYGAFHKDHQRLVFNHTCKRAIETGLIDVHHEQTFVFVEISDNGKSKGFVRRNGEGWIRLEYIEMNSHQWITLRVCKDLPIKFIQLLPPVILKLRLIQELTTELRPSWSLEHFHVFYLHSDLKWSVEQIDIWNGTFLSINRDQSDTVVYQTKDVLYNSSSIIQFELNCTDWSHASLKYSIDLGLNWLSLGNEQDIKTSPIIINPASMRLTYPFESFPRASISIRFQLSFNSSCYVQYLYIGSPCQQNCHGLVRCNDGECHFHQAMAPIADFRETFERNFQENHWLHLDPYKESTNGIIWTTIHRQAISRAIDLRPLRALKWVYHFTQLSKQCQAPIYLLLSTDGTLTWSIVHELDMPIKTTNSNSDIAIEISLDSRTNDIGHIRLFQPVSTTCANMTWGLSRIIPLKLVNVYFLNDYFYTLSSSSTNWESIHGAHLTQIDQCNNQVPSLIFDQSEFSIVTVPVLVQSDYVVVFQFKIDCHLNENMIKVSCPNMSSSIEYRSEWTKQWIKLADMSDLACRTSLMNTGYFKVHTIKLPFEAFSSGTQFRWIGKQVEGMRWSMHTLFIGECPHYCNDRGLCTISGCQCTINYTGVSCETYIGKQTLPAWFNETFDDSSVVSLQGPGSNNWIKLAGDGHIRHLCDENVNETIKSHLQGQALHFGPGCGCGNVEAITRELNITQAKSLSFAFHVTKEDNCMLTTNNVTVALEWTDDEGISWSRLMTMYNQQHPQFFNITLSIDILSRSKKRSIGGVRFRWTQVERVTSDVFWAIDTILLE